MVFALYIQEIPGPVLVLILAAGALFWLTVYGLVVVWWSRRFRAAAPKDRTRMILVTVPVLAVLALIGAQVP